MGEEYRHIGKATPRKDARAIVTGSAQYIDDVKLPGMLHGRVLRSPYPHARIKNIDTSKAEAYPGLRHYSPIRMSLGGWAVYRITALSWTAPCVSLATQWLWWRRRVDRAPRRRWS